MKRAAIISAGLTAALSPSPAASAKTLMDIFGKWQCSVQMYDGSGTGSHTQFYGFGGSSWREGDLHLTLAEGNAIDFEYRLVATVSVAGDIISETGYTFPKANARLNGVANTALADRLTGGLMKTNLSETSILFVDDRTLIMNNDSDLTACTKLD